MGKLTTTHLPIISDSGEIIEYFKTEKPNDFNNINRHQINFDDVIPLDTNIKEIIEKFSISKRTFYFLSFQKNISGLITLGNLNCRQVQVYIFGYICELERELGNFINFNLSNKTIIEYLESKINPDNSEDKYREILKQYDDLISLDLENKLTEHFFLIDFFKIICDFNLYLKLNYSKSEWKRQSSINEIRLRVCHPTRSLLDGNNDIVKLKERLDKIDDLIFRLNRIARTATV